MTKAQERRLVDAVNATAEVEDALAKRDKAIRAAANVGVTPYRLAQETGLSAPGIAKIIKRGS
jgi:hypothetical protein